MSLSEYLESMAIPPGGLGDVRRRAERRTRFVSKVIAAVSVVVALAVSGLGVVQPSFVVADAPTRAQPASEIAHDFSPPQPSPAGLPGAASASTWWPDLLFYGSVLGFILVVVSAIWMLRTSNRRRPLFLMAIGILMPVGFLILNLLDT